MNKLDIQLTVVYAPVYFVLFLLLIAFCSGIDFDDEELPYKEPNKSNIKVQFTLSLFVVSCSNANFCSESMRNSIGPLHLL
jgi:hypothetical protein